MEQRVKVDVWLIVRDRRAHAGRVVDRVLRGVALDDVERVEGAVARDEDRRIRVLRHLGEVRQRLRVVGEGLLVREALGGACAREIWGDMGRDGEI